MTPELYNTKGGFEKEWTNIKLSSSPERKEPTNGKRAGFLPKLICHSENTKPETGSLFRVMSY